LIDNKYWDNVAAFGIQYSCKAYGANMISKSDKGLKSKKVVGILWLLAGLLMLIPPVFLDGNRTYFGIGIMFLILGVVFLRRDRKK
jgi:hypothetical protein